MLCSRSLRTEPPSGGEGNSWAMRRPFGEGAAGRVSALAVHECRQPGKERDALRSGAGKEGQPCVEGSASLRRRVKNHVARGKKRISSEMCGRSRCAWREAHLFGDMRKAMCTLSGNRTEPKPSGCGKDRRKRGISGASIATPSGAAGTMLELALNRRGASALNWVGSYRNPSGNRPPRTEPSGKVTGGRVQSAASTFGCEPFARRARR